MTTLALLTIITILTLLLVGLTSVQNSRRAPPAGRAVFAQVISTERKTVYPIVGRIGYTRTRNVMIDIIAQSGRHLEGRTAPGNFFVEGERR